MIGQQFLPRFYIQEGQNMLATFLATSLLLLLWEITHI